MTEAPADHTGSQQDKQPDKGKLYRWDGNEFQEVVFEKGADRKVPITEDAYELAQKVRGQVQKKIKMRPDVSIVISAMVQHAAESPDIVEAVAQYGLNLYAKVSKRKG